MELQALALYGNTPRKHDCSFAVQSSQPKLKYSSKYLKQSFWAVSPSGGSEEDGRGFHELLWAHLFSGQSYVALLYCVSLQVSLGPLISSHSWGLSALCPDVFPPVGSGGHGTPPHRGHSFLAQSRAALWEVQGWS